MLTHYQIFYVLAVLGNIRRLFSSEMPTQNSFVVIVLYFGLFSSLLKLCLLFYTYRWSKMSFERTDYSYYNKLLANLILFHISFNIVYITLIVVSIIMRGYSLLPSIGYLLYSLSGIYFLMLQNWARNWIVALPIIEKPDNLTFVEP